MNNWLVIIVFVIFLVGFLIGFLKGFLKLGISLLATAITIAIMIFLTPIVGGFIMNRTPLNDVIDNQTRAAFMPSFTYEEFQHFDLSGTPLDGLSEAQWEELTELDFQRVGITEETILEKFGDIPRDTQAHLLENAPVPEFFRTILTENNNNVVYNLLGVNNFPEYAAAMLSRIIIYVVSFLVTFILAIIIVRALLAAVDVIGELPVVGIFNRMGGIVLGGVLALIFIWIIFMVITLLFRTEIGMTLFEQIEQNQLLSLIYDNNIIMNRLLEF